MALKPHSASKCYSLQSSSLLQVTQRKQTQTKSRAIEIPLKSAVNQKKNRVVNVKVRIRVDFIEVAIVLA